MKEPTPDQVSDWKVAFVWYGILAFLIYLGASSAAVKYDVRGELVTYSSCTILEKNSYERKNETRYSIVSTCGNHSTNRQTFGYVQLGMIYDLKTTKGNWAHSPYLMAAAIHQT